MVQTPKALEEFRDERSWTSLRRAGVGLDWSGDSLIEVTLEGSDSTSSSSECPSYAWLTIFFKA